jgi:hypothetical protein
MSYVSITAMLILVLFPVLLPGLITAGHLALGTNRRMRHKSFRLQDGGAVPVTG